MAERMVTRYVPGGVSAPRRMFIFEKIWPVASSYSGVKVNVAPGMPLALRCGGAFLNA
jgi:hypothetical protein